MIKDLKEIKIERPLKYSEECDFTKKYLDAAICDALKKVDYMIEAFGEDFPAPASKNNVYVLIGNEYSWTQGFWTGILWLAYELSGKDKYKLLAEKHLPSYERRLKESLNIDHHDMGFLYTPSCVAAYKLTGDDYAKRIALLAADNLMSRFQEKGGFIQAWGELGAENNYRLIIDCLLNIPLLYWASDITGDEKYKKCAYTHFRTTLENSIREDATTYHTFFFDKNTGAPIMGKTAQGAADDSCWARGQAWGIYGIMMTKKYIDDPDAVWVCKSLANYFINRMPEDNVVFWDLIFYDDACGEYKDSAASAIAVCGILELIRYLCGEEATLYRNICEKIMKSLYQNYSTKDELTSSGLLLHAAYNVPKNSSAADECNIWGDYFYMEALVRFKKKWNMYW